MVLAGNLVGDVVIALAVPAFTTMAVVNVLVFVAYLIGAAAAYGRMSRGSVVYLLSAVQ